MQTIMMGEKRIEVFEYNNSMGEYSKKMIYELGLSSALSVIQQLKMFSVKYEYINKPNPYQKLAAPENISACDMFYGVVLHKEVVVGFKLRDDWNNHDETILLNEIMIYNTSNHELNLFGFDGDQSSLSFDYYDYCVTIYPSITS